MKPDHLLWEEHYWAAGAKGKGIGLFWEIFLGGRSLFCLCFQILLPVRINGL